MQERDQMKLSVLITTYNLEKYIDQALGSVFGQKTSHDYEVIIGDDGSTDDTIIHLRKWKEKYPDVLSFYVMPRERNMKYDPIIRASENRLSILKYAKGEYVTFLDGDDFYIDHYKFQKQIDILDKNKECSVCLSNYNDYYEDKDETVEGSDIDHNGVLDPGVYWKNYYVHAATGIYRNIFTDEWSEKWGHRPFDDNLIVFNQLKYGMIYFIPDRTLNYRQNQTPWKEKNRLEQELINLVDYDIEIQINPTFSRSSLCRHYRDLFRIHINRRKLIEYIGTEYEEYVSTMHGKIALSYIHWSHLKISEKIYNMIRFILFSLVFCYNKMFINLKNRK